MDYVAVVVVTRKERKERKETIMTLLLFTMGWWHSCSAIWENAWVPVLQ